jgi:hypothetical protein
MQVRVSEVSSFRGQDSTVRLVSALLMQFMAVSSHKGGLIFGATEELMDFS